MITISIMSGLFKSDNIRNCAIVLDVLNEANEQKDVKHKIDFKEFYNDAINKEVSLKDHIKLWLLEREKAKKGGYTFDRHKVFTFCSYPWILDAANKSDILKHES
jgi:hypothetical protein